MKIELPPAQTLQQMAEQLIECIRHFKADSYLEKPFASQEFTDDRGDVYEMKVTRIRGGK